ncbi:MAG: Gfo/Idh/MocA family oxidoreductase [Alphaproteobacteria bacterium]
MADKPANKLRVAAVDVSHWHARYDSAWLPTFRDLGATFVGMSDPKQEVAAARAEEFGGEVFSDYREMIHKTKPDFVVAMGRHVDMPERFHFLVDEGVPFLMEKPWGTDAKTVNEMVEKSERKGAWTGIPYSSRYNSFTLKAREMIEAEEFGTISHMQYRSMRPRQLRYAPWDSEWMYDRQAAGGGVMINIGSHGFDLARHLTGEEPDVLSAVISNHVDGRDVEEYALATMRTPSGIIFNNEMGYLMPAWPGLATWPKNSGEQEMKVVGDKAILRLFGGGLQILKPDHEEFVESLPPYQIGAQALARDYLEAFARGDGPPVPPRAAARTMDLIQDAYRLAGRD